MQNINYEIINNNWRGGMKNQNELFFEKIKNDFFKQLAKIKNKDNMIVDRRKSIVVSRKGVAYPSTDYLNSAYCEF